jgi:hypothetical protein
VQSAFSTTTLDRGDCSASRSCQFTCGDRILGTLCIESSRGHRVGLNVAEKRQIRQKNKMFLSSAPLANTPPFVSRLSTQCRFLNISQRYRSPQPVTEMALLSFTLLLSGIDLKFLGLQIANIYSYKLFNDCVMS